MSNPDIPQARQDEDVVRGWRGALAFYAVPFRDRNFLRFMLFFATLTMPL